MIDRAARDHGALALRRFAADRVTDDEFADTSGLRRSILPSAPSKRALGASAHPPPDWADLQRKAKENEKGRVNARACGRRMSSRRWNCGNRLPGQ